MNVIRVGMGILNTQVGNISHNLSQIMDAAQKMDAEHCALGCFNEQTISGYPCEDLVQWQDFVKEQWQALLSFAEMTATKQLCPIFLVGLTVEHKGILYNAAAVVYRGVILGIVPKEKLPTYYLFYEARYFSPGIPGMVDVIVGTDIPFGDLIFQTPFGCLAVEICEDIWSPNGPMERRAYAGASIIANLSASPYRVGVNDTRREMISTRAADNQATVIYVNQVGGQDALVFDGGGYINQAGRMKFVAERFVEGVQTCLIDVDEPNRKRVANSTWRGDHQAIVADKQLPTPTVIDIPAITPQLPTGVVPDRKAPMLSTTLTARQQVSDELLATMWIGLRDYLDKNPGVFNGVAIGLSGGKDSFLTLLIAYLWAEEKFANSSTKADDIRNAIHCFSMPSRFNSEATKSIALEVCEELGVSFKEIGIQAEFDIAAAAAAANSSCTENELDPITFQNIQARVRGARMWNISNQLRLLFLQTGNMTEVALGYTTIGGDMEGGLGLIGNLPKTVVIELLKYLAETRFAHLASLKRLLQTPASAELAHDQSDERDLMPFEVADTLLELLVGERLSAVDACRVLLAEFASTYTRAELVGWTKKFVILFRRSVYKWVQRPLSINLGKVNLDRESALRYPVTTGPVDTTELDALLEEDYDSTAG